MKHYFTRLEEAMKANWERPALGNFRIKTDIFTGGVSYGKIIRKRIHKS